MEGGDSIVPEKSAGRSRIAASRELNKGRWLRLHPLSGIAILVIDNIFFGIKIMTAGTAWPLTVTFAFLLSFLAVWLIQRLWVGEETGMSLVKALVSGFIAGIPTSIAGTFLGAWVITRSGLSPKNLLKRPGRGKGKEEER